MNIYLYILLTILVVASGISVLYFDLKNSPRLKLLLAFSGAYLFAITFLHLLPEVYAVVEESAGMYILAGFFIQILLEFFSKGIEHGHIHLHDEKQKSFPWPIFLSLCIHSFLEGMPLEGHESHAGGHVHANNLMLGIVLHKIPVSIMLVTLLLQGGVATRKVIIALVIFALMMPAGTLMNGMIEGTMTQLVTDYSSIVLGIILGILLHISTTILFESSANHRFNGYKFLAILIGMLLGFFSA